MIQLSRKIILLVLLALFTAPLAFAQSEALKVVVNNLAYYRQKGEVKYLTNAKKSVDSLIKTKSDSANLDKNLYKAIVYSSIAYVDSTNKLGNPPDFFDKTVALVNRLAENQKIYKYRTEIDFAKRCIANVYIRNGFDQIKRLDYNSAVASFKNAQAYSPRFGQVNAYIAYANTKAGNLAEAVKFYTALITPDSVKTEYVVAAASIYKTMGDTSKALDVLEKGRKLLPKEKSFVLEQANIYNSQKNYRALEPLLKDLLDAYGNNADAAFIAATCYDNLDDYSRAEAMYLRAIELNNAAYDPVFNLGLLYLKQAAAKKGEEANPSLDRASQWLQKAYEMSPKSVNTLKLLQLIYAKTGNDTQLTNINTKLQQLTN